MDEFAQQINGVNTAPKKETRTFSGTGAYIDTETK